MGMYNEEIEIIEKPDGTSTIKVISSKRSCHEVTKPFEDAKGKVAITQEVPNPGQKTQNKMKGGR